MKSKKMQKQATWMPIESAPIDGLVILVYDSFTTVEGLPVVAWCDAGASWHCAQNDEVIYPTHWMPIPEVPHKKNCKNENR